MRQQTHSRRFDYGIFKIEIKEEKSIKKFYMFFLFLILVGCGGNNEIENGESPDDPYISIDEIVEDVVLGGRMYAGQTVKINGLVEIEADLFSYHGVRQLLP